MLYMRIRFIYFVIRCEEFNWSNFLTHHVSSHPFACVALMPHALLFMFRLIIYIHYDWILFILFMTISVDMWYDHTNLSYYITIEKNCSALTCSTLMCFYIWLHLIERILYDLEPPVPKDVRFNFDGPMPVQLTRFPLSAPYHHCSPHTKHHHLCQRVLRRSAPHIRYDGQHCEHLTCDNISWHDAAEDHYFRYESSPYVTYKTPSVGS